jgi:hypothetical protein
MGTGVPAAQAPADRAMSTADTIPIPAMVLRTTLLYAVQTAWPYSTACHERDRGMTPGAHRIPKTCPN